MAMTRRRTITVCLLICISLVSIACHSNKTDPSSVEALLEARREAQENRDADAYRRLIAAHYQDRSGGRDEAIKRFKSSLEAYDKLAITITGRDIVLDGNTAKAEQNYFMLVTKDGHTQSIRGIEKLYLEKTSNHWLIVGGLDD